MIMNRAEIIERLKKKNYKIHVMGNTFGAFMFDYQGSGKNVDVSVNMSTKRMTFYLDDKAVFDIDTETLKEIIVLSEMKI